MQTPENLPVSEQQNTGNPYSRFDIIYVDACTWMAEEIESYLLQNAYLLNAANKKLTMTASVLQELENCSTLKYAAQTALQIKERYAHLINVEEGEVSPGTADGEFVRLFFFNHRKRSQLLITHDQQLATDIRNCCSDTTDDATSSTAVMTLWPDGELITFPELVSRKDSIARNRLAEMVGNSPIYLDSSSLIHENLPLFLEHITAPMLGQDKKVQIVNNSLSPEIRETLSPILEEHANLLQQVQTDPTLTETDALLGELYLNPANMGTGRLILVTDDVTRANELRTRRPKCDRFPFIDFMTINKYGYLSYLKLSEPTATAPRPRYTSPVREYSPRSTSYDRGYSVQQERKPSAYVPQLIGAIKSEDIEAMCAYIAKGANLRNGIITSLCQNKDVCLRVLLETAAPGIDASCFEWWVTSFYSFAQPMYLAENAEHFALMKLLIEKSSSMEQLTSAMTTLAERVSAPEAAHEQLWTIIRMALKNGAPAAVYSHATGETLPEIAIRQGNTEMLTFLQSR